MEQPFLYLNYLKLFFFQFFPHQCTGTNNRG